MSAWIAILRVAYGRAKRSIDRISLKVMLRYYAWQARRNEGREEHREDVYFDDPAWRSRPAREMLGSYLDKVEAVVRQAEERFPGLASS